MKQPKGLFDRPISVISEPKSKENMAVQHRTDILLDEQITNVKDVQDSLQRALLQLERAKTVNGVNYHMARVDELKQRSDQMVLTLQMMSKVNSELAYARVDLKKALKLGVGVIDARKRVTCLERHIEQTYERVHNVGKLNSPIKENSTFDCNVDTLVADSLASAKSSVKRDSLGDSPRPSDHDPQDEIGDDKSEQNKAMDDVRIGSPAPYTDSACTPSGGDGALYEPHNSNADIHITLTGASPTHEDACSEDVTDRGSEVISEDKPVFVTQASSLLSVDEDSRDGRHSHVTRNRPISAEDNEDQQWGQKMAATSSPAMEDSAEEYWQTERARFDYSEHIPVLLKMNPLSYHNVGIAVPSSFVKTPLETGYKLPWQLDETIADVTDIHQVALDKLSGRVHRLCGKVKDAAELCVNTNTDHVTTTNLFASATETELTRKDSPSTTKSIPTLAKYGVVHPSSREELPKITKGRIDSSYSGRLICYPDPLPYPNKLPPAKSEDTVFPVKPSVFSTSVPGLDEPPLRFVDQRNLLQETKFTSSLYRPKPRRVKKPQSEVVTPTGRGPEVTAKRNAKNKNKSTKMTPVKLKSTSKNIVAAQYISDDEELDTAQSTYIWNELKPKSNVLEHSGMKWERVKDIVHNSLCSPNAAERIDAAKNLGAMHSADTMVLYALQERLQNDPVDRVKYEAAKSLFTLGVWDDQMALDLVVEYLVNSNRDIKLDLLETLLNSKNIQFADKQLPIMSELIKALSVLSRCDDLEDPISFKAAICLGNLCVADKNAKKKLIQALNIPNDTHGRARALYILIKQMNCCTPDIVQATLRQLQYSPAWKLRKEAAQLLINLGVKHVCADHQGDVVYEVLERRLWDDPNKEVRQDVAKVLAALDMYPRACENIEKKLDASKEEVRARAIISMGTMGMKNERVTRQLLEMLDLDSSQYVRLMIIRTFATLNINNRRVVRALREREKGDGALAIESRKTLQALGLPLYQGTAK